MYTQEQLNALPLIDFATVAYRDHDLAHDIAHATDVTNLMLKLRDVSQLSMTECILLPAVGFLHDALDHKFVAAREAARKNSPVKLGLEEAEIANYLAHHYGADYAEIMRIHRNCSWSNRGAPDRYGKYEVLHKLLEDADWICAIDLYRCIEYTTEVQRKDIVSGKWCPLTDEISASIKRDVIKHINEKLLQIRPNLHSEQARQYVITHNLEAPLREYLAKNM